MTLLVLVIVFFKKKKKMFHPFKNQLGFHMTYLFFRHYEWFLQNLKYDFIQTIMHMTALSEIFFP